MCTSSCVASPQGVVAWFVEAFHCRLRAVELTAWVSYLLRLNVPYWVTEGPPIPRPDEIGGGSQVFRHVTQEMWIAARRFSKLYRSTRLSSAWSWSLFPGILKQWRPGSERMDLHCLLPQAKRQGRGSRRIMSLHVVETLGVVVVVVVVVAVAVAVAVAVFLLPLILVVVWICPLFKTCWFRTELVLGLCGFEKLWWLNAWSSESHLDRSWLTSLWFEHRDITVVKGWCLSQIYSTIEIDSEHVLGLLKFAIFSQWLFQNVGLSTLATVSVFSNVFDILSSVSIEI